jgi:hypothetical protein
VIKALGAAGVMTTLMRTIETVDQKTRETCAEESAREMGSIRSPGGKNDRIRTRR